MIRDLGYVKPGTTLYLPFHTFDSNDPSASVTLTGLATTDIEIYKNGSATQRASDSGYALLDTDGIDFDSITGIHGISIDLSDNTTAGFYEAGQQYWVVISSVTVDAATVNFVLCTFRIGYEFAALNTSIATLASQTSFTLADGSADNDAYNGFAAYIHDVAGANQVCLGIVSDYVGSTRTVALEADPGVFTIAASDNISLIPGFLTTGVDVQTIEGVDATDQIRDAVVDDATRIDASALNTASTAIGSDGTGLTEAGGTGDQLTAIPWNAAWDAEVQSEVTDALNAYDPPTRAELTSDINGLNDLSSAEVTTAVEAASNVSANVTQISGSTEAADNLEESAEAIITGTAQTGTLSTTQASTNLTGYADDELIGREIIFKSGTANGQASTISDYANTNGLVTFDTITTAPANGDLFVIV